MEENAIYDLIIVGGGPAGLSAGIYGLRAALAAAHYVEGKKAGGACELPQHLSQG